MGSGFRHSPCEKVSGPFCPPPAGVFVEMATAGTPLRRARSFHRVRTPLNELGEPGRSYHGRAMASLSLKDHASLQLASLHSSGDVGSHAAVAHRAPSPLPTCGTPVRRARSFQRVLSPRRERACSLPAGGDSRTAGVVGTPVRRARSFQRVLSPRRERARSLPAGGSSGAAGVGGAEASSASAVAEDKGPGSDAPFPLAGRPVRRAGSFQRVVSPRRSSHSEPWPWP